ncbi:MAG TPA: outer membrane beta-barrel protein [Rhizomicrobium sp.]|nr:outer membrane beta-barrel protein [Rhizomicrobium sp.]
MQPVPPAVVPVYQMSRPLYQPPGFEIGSFVLAPSVAQTLTYDDNIYASDRHQAGDLISTTTETLVFRSQWRRHSVNARAFFSQQLFLDHGTENANIYGAETSTRLDISDTAVFEADAGFVQQPQLRNSPQADRISLNRPLYNTLSSAIRYVQDWDRFRNIAEVSAIKTAYIADADASRSAVRWRYRDRFSFAVTGDSWAFVQASYATQGWLRNGDLRNFDALTVLAGFNTQIAGLADVELGAGMLRQSYKFSGFEDLLVPTFSGRMTWNVLPLTTVTASVERTVSGLEVFCDKSLGSISCAKLSGNSIPGLLQDLNTYTGCQAGPCRDAPAFHYAGILQQASHGLFKLPAGTRVAVPAQFQQLFGTSAIDVEKAMLEYEALRFTLMQYGKGLQGAIFGDQRGALTSTSAGIGIQHEFWHNLLGELQFRYEQDEFEPAGLVNRNYAVHVDGRFLVNRNMELGLSYSFRARTANDDVVLYNSGPYQENTVSLALKIAL